MRRARAADAELERGILEIDRGLTILATSLGGRLLSEALRRTVGDPSTLWRAPLLAVVSMTGVGTVFTLGYAFSVQDHVALGGDEYPEVDLDYLWYGLKFAVAVIVLLIPAFLVLGGLAVPALLDIGEATLAGEGIDATLKASTARLVLAAVLGGVWLLVLLAFVPGLMVAFLESDGRIGAALNPLGAMRVARRAPTGYAQLVFVLACWLAASFALYATLEVALPTGSVVPMLVVASVVVPISIVALLVTQVTLGLFRREALDADEDLLDGWHHLEDQNAPA